MRALSDCVPSFEQHPSSPTAAGEVKHPLNDQPLVNQHGPIGESLAIPKQAVASRNMRRRTGHTSTEPMTKVSRCAVAT